MDVVDDGVIGYLRLSREEERERGTNMEEKIALRREILVTLARESHLPLGREQIVVELLSGGSLEERTGLLGILERCRSGEIHTVICFDVDRLTRDVADLKIIMNAFFRGRVTLITHRDTYRFDKHFDTTLLQILAVLGEKERRSFSIRRRAANDQRTRNGQWSQGLTPYGYRWDKTARIFLVDQGEYPVLAEILRRSWTEGSHQIAADLNSRGIRAPGEGKRINTSGRWTAAAVRGLSMNPIYCGHLVKRVESDRERKSVPLPAAQWIWSEKPLVTHDEEGQPAPLPHPLERDEWEALQEVRIGRRHGQPSVGLLTGLIFCARGRPMQRRQEAYACGCKEAGHPHQPASILRKLIEPAVWEVVWRAIGEAGSRPVPENDFDEDAGRKLDLQIRLAMRQMREKEETLQDLVRRSSYYRSLPYYRAFGADGKSNFDRELEVVGGECEDLKARVEELERCRRVAELRPSSKALDEALVLAEGREHLDEMPIARQRRALRLIVTRVSLVAPPEGFTTTKAVRVEWFDLVSETVRVEEVRIEWVARRGQSARS